jgi:hypothetical protein
MSSEDTMPWDGVVIPAKEGLFRAIMRIENPQFEGLIITFLVLDEINLYD